MTKACLMYIVTYCFTSKAFRRLFLCNSAFNRVFFTGVFALHEDLVSIKTTSFVCFNVFLSILLWCIAYS